MSPLPPRLPAPYRAARGLKRYGYAGLRFQVAGAQGREGTPRRLGELEARGVVALEESALRHHTARGLVRRLHGVEPCARALERVEGPVHVPTSSEQAQAITAV